MPNNNITNEPERTSLKSDRRTFGKAVLASVLGGPAALSSIARAGNVPRASRRSEAGDRGMKLALMLRPENPHNWVLASQIGVNHAIVPLSQELGKITRDKYLDKLAKLQAAYAEAGVTIAGVESHPVPAEKIKLGVPGRDEEIENYIAVIEALGKLGIPMCCYNFMAGLGWYRTKVDIPERGGALASEFDNEDAKKEGLTEWGRISEEKIWENLTYFIKIIMPVAEKANVQMALHPDDPPLSPFRGIGRILINAEAFRRVFRIAPSPVNGLCFCQANFKLMGEDIKSLVREFSGQKKLFFVHLRDVIGTRDHFRETFHDNGPTSMPEMLKLYHDVGFRGPIRPDHAPTLAAESNARPGYAVQGKIFAIGYMKGIAETLNIPLM